MGIVLMAGGCAGAPVVEDAVYQEGDAVVRVQAWPESADLDTEDEFQHPLEISETDLAVVLGSVRIQKRSGYFGKDIRAVPAFSKKEVKRMAGPISRALAEVSPRERVAFQYTVPSGKWFRGTTSGVLFVRDNRLNLILGRYGSSARPHQPDIRIDDDPLPTPPYIGFRLAAGPGQALVPEEESPVWREPVGDDQWVMIDYREILAHPPDRVPFSISSPSAEGYQIGRAHV